MDSWRRHSSIHSSNRTSFFSQSWRTCVINWRPSSLMTISFSGEERGSHICSLNQPDCNCIKYNSLSASDPTMKFIHKKNEFRKRAAEALSQLAKWDIAGDSVKNRLDMLIAALKAQRFDQIFHNNYQLHVWLVLLLLRNKYTLLCIIFRNYWKYCSW